MNFDVNFNKRICAKMPSQTQSSQTVPFKANMKNNADSFASSQKKEKSDKLKTAAKVGMILAFGPIIGGAKASVEKQNLKIGLFDEKTEDNLNLGATLGASINNKTNVSLNYRKEKDKLSPIYNNSTVSINFGVNL